MLLGVHERIAAFVAGQLIRYSVPSSSNSPLRVVPYLLVAERPDHLDRFSLRIDQGRVVSATSAEGFPSKENDQRRYRHCTPEAYPHEDLIILTLTSSRTAVISGSSGILECLWHSPQPLVESVRSSEHALRVSLRSLAHFA
eukprot:CAMPEP_0170182910 /NCGR_PEP_ID=MMETSP0040_2-20121228/29115_1 /TAXON_ID=641309 /ORGANISM="Lotharella oceanica, Strain CCMP622" /LENGTH=141 /DNA_ID=CAMNT_0010428489 /DNA_START=88 /DNA_END=510 /DNA_ORIENTATION=-